MDSVCVYVWGNVCLCQTTVWSFITNGKLCWTMIMCSSAQELIMSNSLSRPSWVCYSGPSWLSRAPWTSWDMWPQWLSPSVLMNPAEWSGPVGRWTSSSELSAASLYLTASTALVYHNSQLTSFVHFTITFGCSLGFCFSGIALGFVLNAMENCWVFFFFFFFPMLPF